MLGLTRDSSFDDVARAIVGETRRRGYSRSESIACLSTGIQESTLRPNAMHPNGKWIGIYQQDSSYEGRNDPNTQVTGFLDRLDVKRGSAGRSDDPWLNIFWLQQRPGEKTAALAFQNGRKAYLAEIQKHVVQAGQLYDRFAPDQSQETPVAVTGDPVWLEDVWREALGDRLVVHEGWKERGAGGVMGVIWGTMIHHTGNDNERVEIIRDGVQQPSGWLPGPLSQALITRDGKLHLIAVGPCNHAGGGNWGTLTDGNRQAIGIECAYDGDPARWPDVMVITMRDAAAAVSRKIGKRAADSVCGHKEYAKPQGRKPDPANMDMDWFRDEVQKDLDGVVFPGEKPSGPAPTEQQPPKGYVVPPNHTELMYDQISGRWEMLGWNTPVEALAILLDAAAGTKNAGKKGFTRGPRP